MIMTSRIVAQFVAQIDETDKSARAARAARASACAQPVIPSSALSTSPASRILRSLDGCDRLHAHPAAQVLADACPMRGDTSEHSGRHAHTLAARATT